MEVMELMELMELMEILRHPLKRVRSALRALLFHIYIYIFSNQTREKYR